jgi:hypothetical protein
MEMDFDGLPPAYVHAPWMAPDLGTILLTEAQWISDFKGIGSCCWRDLLWVGDSNHGVDSLLSAPLWDRA